MKIRGTTSPGTKLIVTSNAGKCIKFAKSFATVKIYADEAARVILHANLP